MKRKTSKPGSRLASSCRHRLVPNARGISRARNVVQVSALALLLASCSVGMRGAAGSEAPGMAALRSGDYRTARTQFETSVKSNGGSEESQCGLLETLRLTGEYQLAETRAAEFLRAKEDSARLHLESARILMERGRYEAAERDYRRALALPAAGSLHLVSMKELASLLEETGRIDAADSMWDRILDEYRQGRVRGSAGLGSAAVAAWHRGYVQDAKDIFLDATGSRAGEEPSLEALSDFGYLFLEKYNATDASGVFRDCLKINKAYPPALVGMALAKRLDSSGGSDTYARTALVTNPAYVPAMTLLAQIHLEDEDTNAAMSGLERALSVNPSSLEALSLLAVCHLFKDDTENFAKVEQKVLGINPKYGNFYHTLAESLVTHRKYQEAVENDLKAVKLDPRLWPAYASLGMNQMRVGDISGGRASLQRAFNGDPFNLWAFNTLELLDQMDKFVRGKSEHFVYLVAQEDQASLLQYAPQIAEEAYRRMTQRYRFTPSGPIQIEIFPDHGGFAVRTLGLPGLGALGVCFGKVVAIDSPRARKAESFNWGSTLWHELAHVITLQMTNHNIPRWYSEGLSVYEEHRARPGWGDDLTIGFVRAYKQGKLLKVNDLNSGMMRPKSPEQIGLSYYQASLFCELIEEKFGFEKIRQSLLLFARNLPAQQVWRESLGWDPATLEEEYSRFVDSRVKSLAAHFDFPDPSQEKPHPGPLDRKALAEALEKRPDDFFLNLQMGTRLREEKDPANAETYLKKAENLFPEYVGVGSPYQILGDMYLEEKRDDDALVQLLGWTRYDETVASPLIKAAEIYRGKKAWSAAAGLLELSVYVQPYDPQTYVLLGEAAGEAGDWATARSAYQVLVGLNPPDPAEARYDLAKAWLGLGRKSEARREVLRALEIAPTFEKAQRLLLSLSGIEP